MLATGLSAERSFGEIIPWLILLAVMVIVGGVLIFLARRLLRQQPSSEPEPFTLQGLRDMRARGMLSDDEFERARAAMIGRLKTNAEPDQLDAAADRPADDATAAESSSAEQPPGSDQSDVGGQPNNSPNEAEDDGPDKRGE